MHPACLPELTHAGVDDRISRLPTLPSLQRSGRASPFERIEFGTEALTVQLGVMEKQVIGEFAPRKFLAESLGVPALRCVAAPP